MATRGFENFTDSDVARHLQKLGTAKPVIDAARQPQKPVKGHKFKAQACIVTSDLTLFSKEDIEQAEAARSEWRPELPLKKRAAATGIVGDWFGSLKEGRRWIELRRLEDAGAIHSLRRQVPYALTVGDVRIGEWRADFEYFELWENGSEQISDETLRKSAGVRVTEDAKGKVLPLDKWKRAHVEAQYQIKIRIT